ncbi:YoaK family protein [Mesorhizobium sp.]|uniref:YoaK family protein n=1 Tax=Mesorhizobium sp. TaxID=1871066 RepID=UPI0025D17196|nr:YoaK family protein [Mesorhizobium sp.]
MLRTLRSKGNSLTLAFISGFADALFFIHIGGLFVGLVTGNVILLGLGLIGHEKGGLHGLQIMTFPLFMLGAGLAAILVAWLKPLERATFWTIIIAACAFAIAASLAITQTGPDAACALFAVVAMGMLTAIERLDSRLGPPFSLMTGNIAGLAVAGARRLIGYKEKPEEWGQSLTSIILVVGFVVGCGAGAFAQKTVGVAGMLLPAILLFLIGISYSPQSEQRRSS